MRGSCCCQNTARSLHCSRLLPEPLPLQDGDYRFHARLAGVAPADGTEAISSLTIDSVAPTATITGMPGGPFLCCARRWTWLPWSGGWLAGLLAKQADRHLHPLLLCVPGAAADPPPGPPFLPRRGT